MGTIISALCTFDISYIQTHKATKVISLTFWFLSVIEFLLFSAMSIARMIMFPEVWGRMMRHPLDALYLSCIPMSMIPIENGMRYAVYFECAFRRQLNQ